MIVLAVCIAFQMHAFAQHTLSDSLIAQMSLKEKLRQITAAKSKSSLVMHFMGAMIAGHHFPLIKSGLNKRLHVPALAFSDGPRGGVVGAGNSSFPVAIALGASFDTALEYKVGTVYAAETQSHGANYFGGICVNLLYYPRWGRAQESFGEDAFHVGEMGLALTRAIQDHGMMGCVKHFAMNNIEENRYLVDAWVDDTTLHEVMLPHFRKIVEQGQVASVMSSYNRYNGYYCGENAYLLRHVLREQWHFKGFVTSDWDWGLRHAVGGVKSWMDIEMPCPRYYGKHLKEAIASGKLNEHDVDTLLQHILPTKLNYPNHKAYHLSKEIMAQHHELAREAAEQSMVLLENHQVLPYEANKVKTMLIMGRFAKKANLGDVGSSRVYPPYHVSPYQGLKEECKRENIKLKYYSGKNNAKAAELAKHADAVVLCVGFDHHDEGEYIMGNPDKNKKFIVGFSNGDRDSLYLHGEDQRLIHAVCAVNKHCTVTFFGGSPPNLTSVNDEIPALLFAWYPGMEGGHALSNILFGKVSPSGKLPFSILRNAEDNISFRPQDTAVRYGYFHGYELADAMHKPLLYPFGYGLSYSHFSINAKALDEQALRAEDTIHLSVEVKNEGNINAAEVIQIYAGNANATEGTLVKRLVAFDKIKLDPGISGTVNFSIPISQLARWDASEDNWKVLPGNYYLYIGNSADQASLQRLSFFIR